MDWKKEDFLKVLILHTLNYYTQKNTDSDPGATLIEGERTKPERLPLSNTKIFSVTIF